MSAGILFDAPGPKARARHRIMTGAGALLVALLAYLVFDRLASRHQLQPDLWKPLLTAEMWQDYLLAGLMNTLKAAFWSILFAGIFGGITALMRLSDIAPLRWVASLVVEFFRAVPVLVMMIFTWGLYSNTMANSDNATLYAVITALTLYNGAVICEVIRAGVASLPAGQREAGISLGLTNARTLRMILLPQAITAMLPTLVSQLVVVLKDTALGYNIIFPELLNSAKDAGTNYTNMLPTLLLVAAIYIVVNYLLTKVAEVLEKRIQKRGKTSGEVAQEPAGVEATQL